MEAPQSKLGGWLHIDAARTCSPKRACSSSTSFVNVGKPDILGLSPEENARAVREGYKALDYFNNVIQRGKGREVLEQLEREDRLGVVLLGRPTPPAIDAVDASPASLRTSQSAVVYPG